MTLLEEYVCVEIGSVFLGQQRGNSARGRLTRRRCPFVQPTDALISNGLHQALKRSPKLRFIRGLKTDFDRIERMSNFSLY